MDSEQHQQQEEVLLTPPHRIHYFPLFHPFSRRLHVVLLCMLGMFTSLNMNVNMALAITCMTNSTAVAIEHEEFLQRTNASNSLLPAMEIVDVDEPKCAVAGNAGSERPTVLDYGGSLVWDSQIQNYLFSAAFWGSLASVVPSIFLVQRLSPRFTFLMCVLNKAIVNLLIPTLAKNFGYHAVFIARFILGMAEPFIIPSVNCILVSWFPVNERSTALALFTTGNQLAMFVGNPITAAFCRSRYGWPGIFYFSGFIGLLWCVLWMSFASNSPRECGVITKGEREFLSAKLAVEKNTARTKKSEPVPWCRLITNMAVIAQLVASCGMTVVATAMTVYLPSYAKEVLLLGVIANGTFISIPPLFMFVFKLSWSMFVDIMKSRKRLTSTAAVRISQTLATFGVGAGFLTIALFVDCTKTALAFVALCVANVFLGAHTSGAYTSLICIAPKFTPTLSSISISLSMIAQVLTPFVVGFVKPTGSLAEWNMLLFIVATISISTGIFFVIFGSGDPQPFATEQKGGAIEVGLLEDHVMRNLRSDSISMM